MANLPKQVNVDLNSRHKGLVRTRQLADGPVIIGELVVAVDDDVAADAVVEEIRDGLIFLRVNWATQRDAHKPVYATPGVQLSASDAYEIYSGRLVGVPGDADGVTFGAGHGIKVA